MRLEYFKCHNVGPFTDFELDLSKVNGPLVAVTAPNGTGKTFILEAAILGAAYRKMATQGSLIGRATARDSFIEARLVNGKRWTIRHDLDAVSRKGESVVLDEQGEPAFKGTSVKAFDKWSERTLPPEDIICSTIFAVQGSSGFLGLGSAERISVILQAVGVARLEKMSELARKSKAKVDTELQMLGSQIAEVRRTAPDLTAAVEEQDRLAELVEDLAVKVRAASDALDTAKLLSADSAISRVRYREQMEALIALEARRDSLRSEVENLRIRIEHCDVEAARNEASKRAELAARAAAKARETELEAHALKQRRDAARQLAEKRARIGSELSRAKERSQRTGVLVANNQYVLDHAEELRTALAKAEELKAEIQRLEVTIAEERGKIDRYGAESAQHDADRMRHNATADEAGRRIARARKALENRQAVEEAAGKLEAEYEVLEAARLAEMQAEEELNKLRERQTIGADYRIGQLRCGFRDVISSIDLGDAKAYAMEALDKDDDAIARIEELPGLLAAANERLMECHSAIRESEDRARKLADLSAQLPVIQAAEEESAAALSERKRALDAAVESDEKAQDAFKLGNRAGAAYKQALNARDFAKRDLVALEPQLKRAAALATAEQRLSELRPQLEQERADQSRLETELAALPMPEEVPADPNVEHCRREAEEAAIRARLASEEAVRLGATLEQLTPQLTRLEGELAGVVATLNSTPRPTPAGDEPNLTALEQALQTAQDEQSEALRQYGAIDQRIEAATAAKRRLDEIEAEEGRQLAELSDWSRLGLDLGRDGIQSAEVDSAGPELTELTNDLLHSCHGSRYTVSIETKRATANGKGEVDECRIMVIDTQAGTEKEAREHSGGEKVIIGEAVSLALSMMACRRAGLEGVTLVRDESGAALDPLNARVYVAMLRRAAAVTRANKVLFVSHSKEVVEMADARVEI